MQVSLGLLQLQRYGLEVNSVLDREFPSLQVAGSIDTIHLYSIQAISLQMNMRLATSSADTMREMVSVVSSLVY